MTYIVFVAEVVDGKVVYYNMINDEMINIGRLKKVRVGKWMSWGIFLNQDCYLSASCFDEVREKVRSLNNNKLKSAVIR